MYMPESFREDDVPTLYALMRNYRFATLLTQHEGVLFASHLAVILAIDEGSPGTWTSRSVSPPDR
jgi:predicted FMN-binding regulatory protein PaiB